MANLDILYDLLQIAMITGAITTLFVQKIKCSTFLNSKCQIVIVSLFLSMVFGMLFTLTFSNFPLIYALWVGLFTFVGAEAIYTAVKKTLNLKTFTSVTENTTTTDEEGDG